MESSPETNPYSPPPATSELRAPPRMPARGGWLRGLCWLQAFVIVAALAGEQFHIETILVSGPTFSLIGLAIAVLAWRHRYIIPAWFGVSAIAFSFFIFALISIQKWGPSDAESPVRILSLGYALMSIPALIFVMRATKGESLVNLNDNESASVDAP